MALQQATKELSAGQALSIVHSEFEENALLLNHAVGLINGWIDRGDGLAIYRNEDLGHPLLGHLQFVSFGSPAAQLEVLTAEELPERLPDIGGRINWRYCLIGYLRGEHL